MPTINKTMIMTAVGVAIGSVIYGALIAPTLNENLAKV